MAEDCGVAHPSLKNDNPNDEASQKKENENPFLNYAAIYWPEHLVGAAAGWTGNKQNSEALQNLKKFVSNSHSITSWLAICGADFDRESTVLISIAAVSEKVRSLFSAEESGIGFPAMMYCSRC